MLTNSRAIAALLGLLLTIGLPSETEGQYCIVSPLEGNMYAATNTVDYFDSLPMVYCNGTTHRCFECTSERDGSVYYVGVCSTNVTNTYGYTCSNPGLTPCKSPNDTDCRPKYMAITEMNKCLVAFGVNGSAEGPGMWRDEIFCKEPCGAAEVKVQNTTMVLMSCRSNCLRWVKEYKKEVPQVITRMCNDTTRVKCDIQVPRRPRIILDLEPLLPERNDMIRDDDVSTRTLQSDVASNSGSGSAILAMELLAVAAMLSLLLQLMEIF